MVKLEQLGKSYDDWPAKNVVKLEQLGKSYDDWPAKHVVKLEQLGKSYDDWPAKHVVKLEQVGTLGTEKIGLTKSKKTQVRSPVHSVLYNCNYKKNYRNLSEVKKCLFLISRS